MLKKTSCQFELSSDNANALQNLCGSNNRNIELLAKHLKIEISNVGNVFKLTGPEKAIQQGKEALIKLHARATEGASSISEASILTALQSFHPQVDKTAQTDNPKKKTDETVIRLHARTPNQQHYIHNILHHRINFGIGPAGTGKTFLAIGCAVQALLQDQVQHIVLTRPAVEAGENLGFLPGTLTEKIDPYLQPLYDALYYFLGARRVSKLIDDKIIELAPLAYMRGRTLNNSFVVLDEAQNSNIDQMKMFLTRIGFDSTMIITGDTSQTDLPKKQVSGLVHAIQILRKIDGISFTEFTGDDVQRHPLVKKVIAAYEKNKA